MPKSPTPTPESDAIDKSLMAWLKQKKPSSVQGWVVTIFVGLLIFDALIDVGRNFGIDDSKYPFATQEQIQKVMDRQAAIGTMVCDLVDATGGEVPPSCASFSGDSL